MAILTNQKPTIYHKLYEYTSPAPDKLEASLVFYIYFQLELLTKFRQSNADLYFYLWEIYTPNWIIWLTILTVDATENVLSLFISFVSAAIAELYSSIAHVS